MQHDVGTYRSKPDGSVDPAGEAGWYLQRERERVRISIDDVAAATGIHGRHIEAIESGDLTDLPPRADTLRMVGVYAEYLGLDPQPLVLHYAQFLPRSGYSRRRKAPRALSSATILEFPLARRMAQIAAASGKNGIVASCVGAALMFGFASWMMSPRPEVTAMTSPHQQVAVASSSELPDASARQPDETAQALQQEGHDVPVASITSLAEEPMDDDAPQATASIDRDADQSADDLDGLTALIEKEVPGSPGNSTASAEQEQDRQYGAENANARLVLKAKAPVWIRIEDGKGNVVATQTLMKGDSYRVPDQEGLVLTARDGSLLSYEVDGVARGNLGTPGEILVGRPLDIAKLASKG